MDKSKMEEQQKHLILQDKHSLRCTASGELDVFSLLQRIHLDIKSIHKKKMLEVLT